MDQLPSRFRYLLHAYTSGTATPAERSELMQLVRMPEHEQLVKELITGEMELLELTDWEMDKQLPEERAGKVLGKILGHVPEQKTVRIGWKRWAAAAAIILLVGLGGLRFLAGGRTAVPAVSVSNDVLPGGDKAILTLANGSTIVLDSVHAGRLIQQGGASVKVNSGRLAYTPMKEKPTEVFYNTLATPRGGQYQLTLPDGSRVWLNAASSIKYPTVFTGEVREVEITGEAYFEIEKDVRMPFVVRAGLTRTTVLGTHFNINAYEDEKMVVTTLLEGAVKFGYGQEEKLLHPGEQAVLNEAARSFSVQQADTYAAVAWKNGQFDFDNKDLSAIMRQISRWYDVDVHYDSLYAGAKFGGGISRQLNLSRVLRLLDKSGVHTRLEDRKIIILP